MLALSGLLHTAGAQVTEYHYFRAEVDEFDVMGDSLYEQNLHAPGDATLKLGARMLQADGSYATQAPCLDANMQTAWLSEAGEAEPKLDCQIDLAETKLKHFELKQIAFYNGCRNSRESLAAYSRVKTFALFINDKPYGDITLEDTYKCQTISLDQFKLDRSHRYRFRFMVKSVYPGKTYQQVALSDLQFIGKVK